MRSLSSRDYFSLSLIMFINHGWKLLTITVLSCDLQTSKTVIDTWLRFQFLVKNRDEETISITDKKSYLKLWLNLSSSRSSLDFFFFLLITQVHKKWTIAQVQNSEKIIPIKNYYSFIKNCYSYKDQVSWIITTIKGVTDTYHIEIVNCLVNCDIPFQWEKKKIWRRLL